MPRDSAPIQHDLQAALDDLDDARDYDAAYYIVLVLRLLRRLNDAESQPTRSLQAVLLDPVMGASSRMAWPEDKVILANPYWLVRGPHAAGQGRDEHLPLAGPLAMAAGRVA